MLEFVQSLGRVVGMIIVSLLYLYTPRSRKSGNVRRYLL